MASEKDKGPDPTPQSANAGGTPVAGAPRPEDIRPAQIGDTQR